MRTLLFTIVVLLLSSIGTVAQEETLAKFTVKAGEFDRFDTPVSVCLNGINYNTDKGALHLYETSGSKRSEIACQIEPGHSALLWWILEG
jgi:hypothetical protein